MTVCGQIVGYADNRDSAELQAALYSQSHTEFGVHINGHFSRACKPAQLHWMATFTDGKCTERMPGYGPLCPAAAQVARA